MVDQRLTVRAVPTVQLEFEDSSKNTQWGGKSMGGLFDQVKIVNEFI